MTRLKPFAGVALALGVTTAGEPVASAPIQRLSLQLQVLCLPYVNRTRSVASLIGLVHDLGYTQSAPPPGPGSHTVGGYFSPNGLVMFSEAPGGRRSCVITREDANWKRTFDEFVAWAPRVASSGPLVLKKGGAADGSGIWEGPRSQVYLEGGGGTRVNVEASTLEMN